jgi:hypothetical protein
VKLFNPKKTTTSKGSVLKSFKIFNTSKTLMPKDKNKVFNLQKNTMLKCQNAKKVLKMFNLRNNIGIIGVTDRVDQ